MNLYSLEHINKNGEMTNLALSKDEKGRLILFIYEDIHYGIEIPITEEILLEMLVSSKYHSEDIVKERMEREL